jgi:hypothetical protein
MCFALTSSTVSVAVKHGHLREDGSDDVAVSSEAESPWLRCLRGSLGVGELQRWTVAGRAGRHRAALVQQTCSTGPTHIERRREYFDWCKSVVDGIRDGHEGLSALFDRAYAKRP